MFVNKQLKVCLHDIDLIQIYNILTYILHNMRFMH